MMFFPKLLSPDKKIHEQLHSPEISKLGMYCMNIGNQADNPRILPSYMHP